MTDAFEEVEEGLRDDRFRAMFRRYGPFGAAAIAAIVLGVAGREGWTAYTEQAATRSSEQYARALTAFESGRPDAALEDLRALSVDGAGGYAALATMLEASTLIDADPTGLGGGQSGGQSDEALARAAARFEDAAQATNDPLLRDMSRLKAAYLLADSLELSELEARLAPVMERGAPFETAARELVGAAALSAGELDRAREAYSYLTVSLEAPAGVRRRAEEALAVIDTIEAAHALRGADLPGAPDVTDNVSGAGDAETSETETDDTAATENEQR